MAPIIEIKALRKRFRRTVAVDELTLDVPEGAVTAFLGPNGAGKTTTIKCLLNLHEPDGGSARLLGTDSRRLGPAEFRQLGYVSENQDLPLWMTVQQFIDYCRPLYPTWDSAFAAKLQRDFDLPARTRLRALSRGMRMKAALLSSLAYRPRLVVLDEPFTGLDPLVRDEFIRGLLELTEEEGWSVFVSSHDIDEVQRLADHVAILDRGRLQLAESAEHLLARFRSVAATMPDGVTLPERLPASWLNGNTSGRVYRFVESAYDPATLAGAIQEKLPGAQAIEVLPMTLREIFVALARTYRLAGLESQSLVPHA